MNSSLLENIINSIEKSKQYNSNQVTAPEVVLWPDPESQWLAIVDILREHMTAFLTLGEYAPNLNQGPAIWIKCMVDRTLPEANWEEDTIPIIYMPGLSKENLKRIEDAPSALQPLMEYQFTGNIWTQENGKEWTIMAFLQNAEFGMGLEVAKDKATKEALEKSLTDIVNEKRSFFRKKVDADFLNELLVPDVIPNLLNWIEEGDKALNHLSLDQQEAFKDVIKSQFGLSLNYSLVLDFVKGIGSQKGPWHKVWQYFANAPHKYPKLIEYLEQATPDDLGKGLFKLPESSWPSVNIKEEEELKKAILKLDNSNPKPALSELKKLAKDHHERLGWVWMELGKSPFAEAIPKMVELAQLCIKSYDNDSISKISKYYKSEGYKIDQLLRQLYLINNSKDYKETIQIIIDIFYRPWLEKITLKFQELVKNNVDIINCNNNHKILEEASFILFVDAFRYDLAIDFVQKLSNKFESELKQTWAALPSLTPTSKPSVSPIASSISKKSEISNFLPYFNNGDPFTYHYFKKKLKENDIHFIKSESEIDDPTKKYWMEIGDIDEKGHNEQAGILQRVPNLLNEVNETIHRISERGIKEVTVVTDHGWLTLPGGLPKTDLHKDLAETRWGRCAELKNGVDTELIQLPWTWNPDIYIAYAPGISFFKSNEEYAHGGLSIQECLTPIIKINSKESKYSVKAFIESYKWVGLRLKVKASVKEENYSLDIRTKRDDKSSSVLLNKPKFENNEWKLMVDSDYEGQACTLLLLNPEGIIVDSKLIEIGR